MNPGDLLRNRFCIKKALAQGGFGHTYLAIDRDYPGQPQVVVKHLLSQGLNPNMLELTRRLFDKEAEIPARLGRSSDGRIPQLSAHFEEQGEFYLVQEFIPGAELAQEFSNDKLREEKVLEILRDILIGLEIVHKQDIVHRDLKPANIIRRSQDRMLVLIDFGAVKEIRNSNTFSPTSRSIGIGTPGYLPAEQANGYPQKASDIYAVGVIGIQALTGKKPPDPDHPDPNALPINSQTLELDWRSFCTISDELATILTKMVRYLYSQRYRDATEALGAIDQLIAQRSQRPIASTPSVYPRPSSNPKISNPAPLPTIKSPPPPAAKTVKAPATQRNHSTPTLASRRQVLKFLGLGSSGVMGVWLLAQLFNRPSSTVTTTPEDAKAGLRKISFTSVRVNKSGKIIERPAGSALAFQEDLGDGVSMTMVKIPAGKFMMGSPESEKDRLDWESPQHSVTVPEFYLGQTLVTQAQWQTLMGSNPSDFKGNSKLPVDSVSWLDAMDFCQKLSQKTGRTYRLPSEAEWEYACRAGTTTPFAFGETITPEIVNYNGNYPYGNAAKGEYRQKTTIVGSFPANSFGLYDMHGNLWEWCLDERSDNYNNAPTDDSARGDINSRASDKLRLLRGGSWFNLARYCRSAHRDLYINASNRNNNVGLRVVSGAASTPSCQNF
jgi:eukaryotic-like serine/threonine-protein kinase